MNGSSFGFVLSQLVSSRQELDTLEKEVVEVRSRENLLLRQQLQELTDFAITMPKDWSWRSRIQDGGPSWRT